MRIVLNMDADLYQGDVYGGHVVSHERVVGPETRSDVIVKTRSRGIIESDSAGGWKIRAAKENYTVHGPSVRYYPDYYHGNGYPVNKKRACPFIS